MPSAATIVLADSVPANRNYVPVSVSGDLARHADTTTAATPAGQSILLLRIRPATNSMARKVNVDFSLPVEYTDSTTGNVLTKDTFRGKSEILIPPTATALQRSNFWALYKSLMAHATLLSYVVNGEPEY